MAWSLVNKASVGGTTETGVVTTAGIVTTTANVLEVAVGSYYLAPVLGDLTDSPNGTFGDSPNTWVLTGATAASPGDGSLWISTYRCISPTTGTSHKVRFTPDITTNGRGHFPGVVCFALTQGSAPTYGTSVSAAAHQAGSIGASGDLVCEAIAFYVNNGYTFSAGYNDLTEVAYLNTGAIGTAMTWKEVSGSVNPTWTPSGSNTVSARADSFTSGSGGISIPVVMNQYRQRR